MTTTDSVEKRGHWCPNGLRRYVHAAVIASFAATLMVSGDVFGEESQDNRVADGYYDAGVKARIDGNLRLALELLRKAWALDQTALIAVKLAQTEHDLGYYRDAIEHFEFFLKQPDQSADDRSAIAQLLAEAKSKIVVLDIRVDTPGAEILVDHSVVGVAPLPQEIVVDPGKRLIEARKERCTFEQKSIYFAPGAKQNWVFKAKCPEPPKQVIVEKKPTWKYVAVPLSLVASGIGLGAGIWRRSQANDLAKEADSQLAAIRGRTPITMYTCGPGSPDINKVDCQSLQSTLQDKDRAANLATAGFIVAGIGAAGAAVMALWPTQRREKMHVVPVIKSSESGFLIQGSF